MTNGKIDLIIASFISSTGGGRGLAAGHFLNFTAKGWKSFRFSSFSGKSGLFIFASRSPVL
jgi:hypothetical protein